MQKKIPTIFLFAGLPSCGKSTLTKKISAELQIPRISTDETWKKISPNSDWSKKERLKMYSAVLIRIKDYVTLGKDILVDGVYSDESYFINMQENLSGIPYKLKVFKVECKLETMLSRLRNRRNHEASDLNEKRLRYLKETVSYKWLKNTTVINTENSFDLYCRQALSIILNIRSENEKLFNRKLLARKIIRNAENQLVNNFRKKMEISKKADDSFVTRVDMAVDNFFKNEISKHFPHDAIHSEESNHFNDQAQFTWHIDPIDGTHMYMSGIPAWCISIGISQIINDVEETVLGMVYDPLHDDLYEAEKGQGANLNGEKIQVSRVRKLEEAFLFAHPGFRKKHSQFFNIFEKSALSCLRTRSFGVTALELCFIAAGFADVYISSAPTAHDLAAGVLILEEGGGTVLNFKGRKFDLHDDNIIAGNKELPLLLAKEIKKVKK